MKRQDLYPQRQNKKQAKERKNSFSGEKRRVCYAWQTTGMCRSGSSCRYAHDQDRAYTPPDYAHRLWSNSQAGTSGEDKPISTKNAWNFSLMSYNILADELAITHARELYRAVPDWCLQWQQRVAKLLDEIRHWQPDVICLQEVDHPGDFTDQMKLWGYDWRYVGRTGGRGDGCLTLWRRDKFQLVAWDNVLMTKFSLKDNVGLIVVLRAYENAKCTSTTSRTFKNTLGPAEGPHIAIGNTHLLFNPKRGDIKLGQAGLMLRRMSAICKDLGIEPIAIFTGDFNSTPQSAIYSFVRHGALDCFLEDRRMLSGQLVSSEGEGFGWPLQSQPSRGRENSQNGAAEQDQRKRGASLDDPSRSFRNRFGMQPAIGIVSSAKAGVPHISHCSSFPVVPELHGAVMREAWHGGPVSTPGQGHLYPYMDQFGQVAWSHIPPSDTDITRQPFYHEPMCVEEAKPPPPPPPPPGVFRTLSFAQRQMNAGTWTQEQLMVATGACVQGGHPLADGKLRSEFPSPSANDKWVAEHPMPMESTYNSVLGTEPGYTSCHGKFIGTVDYIWFTPQAGAFKLAPTSVLLPPPLESLHCGLPSPEWPSDHISLLVNFTLSSDCTEPHTDGSRAADEQSSTPQACNFKAPGSEQQRPEGVAKNGVPNPPVVNLAPPQKAEERIHLRLLLDLEQRFSA